MSERKWSARSGGDRINCPTCPSHDVTEQHVGRCAITTRERAAAKALGAAKGIPEVTTDDLWAHLGHIGSTEDSTRIIRQVIDLGWRPVVGSEPKRLWTDDAAGAGGGG